MTHTSDLHFIFPGRFQPFHNDHDMVIRQFGLDFPDAMLCVAIVFGFVRDGLPSDSYDLESAEHFLPERNPWNPAQTLLAVQRYIATQSSTHLISTLIPQPSRLHSWGLIESMFPGQRIWIVPSCGEAWDDKKAMFFQSMGDEVIRISVPSQVSGFSIRTALFQGNLEVVKNSVPISIWQSIKEFI